MDIDRSAPPRPAMSTTLGHLLALALAFAVAGAAAEHARAADADDRPRFTILDEDDDGVVTKIEFLRNKTKIFFRAVKDHIDQDPRLGPDEINVTPQAFDEADLNGDGKLSGAEFVQARFTQFDSVDANGDQKITSEEFQAFARQYPRL
jgi:Ca2+-binding EF-hand superfamily protein